MLLVISTKFKPLIYWLPQCLLLKLNPLMNITKCSDTKGKTKQMST